MNDCETCHKSFEEGDHLECRKIAVLEEGTNEIIGELREIKELLVQMNLKLEAIL